MTGCADYSHYPDQDGDALCSVRVGFIAFDDHSLDDVPNCRLQRDPDHVTGCDGYSQYPDLDTAAPHWQQCLNGSVAA